MDVPEDFRVDIPRSFGWQTGTEGGDNNPRQTPDGTWVEVQGGGLPVPLVARISRTRDGRFVVTGLLIGRDDHREIDWSTLRSIKPASIVSMIFAGFDPKDPKQLVDQKLADDIAEMSELPEMPRSIRLTLSPPTAEEIEAAGGYAADLEPISARVNPDLIRALVAHDLWRKNNDPKASRGVAEATRPRASVATNLTDFAERYMRNYAANPRRATRATADELHISRATAIRRIKECRDLGLIPPQEGA